MADFNALIPELRRWNGGQGIDVESWIGCVGDFQKMIGYSAIFWPRFVEIDGMVVLEGVTRENLQQWLVTCQGSRSRVEATVNHLHLVGLHADGAPDATPERLAYLGRILKEIYECKLKWQFPDKHFVVAFDESPSGQLHEYILRFYQEHPNQFSAATSPGTPNAPDGMRQPANGSAKQSG